MSREQHGSAWWRRSDVLGLVALLALWSVFWSALVDPRVVDAAAWARIAVWAGGTAALLAAARRSPVHWYDPFDSWGARAGRRLPRPARGPDRVKRALVLASVALGLGGPWLLTSLTESLAVHFALGVHDAVRHLDQPEERRSITRLAQAARDRGGAARIDRIGEDGTAYVTVWDRPEPGTPDADVPPPPNPGNAACIMVRAGGRTSVTDGSCTP